MGLRMPSISDTIRAERLETSWEYLRHLLFRRKRLADRMFKRLRQENQEPFIIGKDLCSTIVGQSGPKYLALCIAAHDPVPSGVKKGFLKSLKKHNYIRETYEVYFPSLNLTLNVAALDCLEEEILVPDPTKLFNNNQGDRLSISTIQCRKKAQISLLNADQIGGLCSPPPKSLHDISKAANIKLCLTDGRPHWVGIFSPNCPPIQGIAIDDDGYSRGYEVRPNTPPKPGPQNPPTSYTHPKHV